MLSKLLHLQATPSPAPTTTSSTPAPDRKTTSRSPTKPSGNDKAPTPIPTPTKAKQCKTQWSAWVNRDNPASGGGDREVWTDAEKQAFCPGGTINKINCTTVDGIPSYSSGEIASCYPDTGFECNNADNFPVPCSDYRISYFCKCPGQIPLIYIYIYIYRISNDFSYEVL